MTADQMDKLKEALDEAGIERWGLTSDIPSNFYNDGKTQIIIPDNSMDGIHAFKRNGFGGAYTYFPNESPICHYFSDYGDIHEFRTAGTMEQITKFVEALGLSLDDNQVKIFTHMCASKNDIKPITGDYTFKPISQEEYDNLTEEEKAIYDKKLLEYNQEKAGISGLATATVVLQ